MFDLYPYHIGIRCEAHHSVHIVQVADFESVSQMRTRCSGIGIEHIYPDIIAKCILNEHPAQLASSQEGDRARAFHVAAKIA